MSLETGIYAIKNKVSGRVYIGATKQGFAQRWVFHRKALERGSHYNRRLQQDFEQGELLDFQFVILEALPAEALMAPREQWWIETLKAEGVDCYNIMTPIEGSPRKFRRTHSRPLPDTYALTVDDVASHLMMCRRTIIKFVQKNELVGMKFGRVWRIAREDLERFVEERKRQEPIP